MIGELLVIRNNVVTIMSPGLDLDTLGSHLDTPGSHFYTPGSHFLYIAPEETDISLGHRNRTEYRFNIKDVVRRNKLYYSNSNISYMFRLHKAAIVRQYVLEKVKRILYSCSHTFHYKTCGQHFILDNEE